jgi:hypothetical protein
MDWLIAKENIFASGGWQDALTFSPHIESAWHCCYLWSACIHLRLAHEYVPSSLSSANSGKYLWVGIALTFITSPAFRCHPSLILLPWMLCKAKSITLTVLWRMWLSCATSLGRRESTSHSGKLLPLWGGDSVPDGGAELCHYHQGQKGWCSSQIWCFITNWPRAFPITIVSAPFVNYHNDSLRELLNLNRMQCWVLWVLKCDTCMPWVCIWYLSLADSLWSTKSGCKIHWQGGTCICPVFRLKLIVHDYKFVTKAIIDSYWSNWTKFWLGSKPCWFSLRGQLRVQNSLTGQHLPVSGV